MGSFTTDGSYGSHWHGDVYFSVNSQNAGANTSSVHVHLDIRADSGYSQVANTSYNVRINGGAINSGSTSNLSVNGNTVGLIDGDTTVYHDTNGNWSGSYGGGFTSSYSGVGSGSGDYGTSVPRLALAPTISGTSVTNLKPTTATINTSISSNGHGTSTGVTVYYRLSGSGGYTSAGTGTAVNLTGLNPGSSYQYYVTAYNNNGDSVSSSVSTFATQSIPGMVPVLLGLM